MTGVVPTMTLTSSWLRLVWDQWYALWDWLWVSGGWCWSGTSGRSCTHYDADFGLVETSLGLVVCTLRLTSGQWRMVWDIIDQFFFFIVQQSRASRAEQWRASRAEHSRAKHNRVESYRSVQGRTRQSRTGRIEQSRARVKLYSAVHLLDE